MAKYNNGITNGNHQALKMVLDTAGNIYVLGVSANANTNTGYAVVKYAPNGNQLWAARYDSTNYPTASPTGFALDSSSRVIVTGSAVTVKYDAHGNLLWPAPFDGQAVAVDPAQNIYITGISNSFTTVKLNPVGSNVWSQTWTYQGLANLSQAIALDALTNVYVAGEEGVVFHPFNAVHIGVLKYDQNGDQLWAQNTAEGLEDGNVKVVGFVLDLFGDVYIEANYLGGGHEVFQTYEFDKNGTSLLDSGNPTYNFASFASGLVIDSNGSIVITGQDAHSPPLPSYGTYKLSTNGYIWTNLYPMSPYGGSAALALTIDASDNIYVTGESSITNTPYDIATLKLDPNGNQLWVQRYKGPGLGNAGNAVAVDNSGNVYVAGYETETNGFTSMILIKYSPVTLQKQPNGNVILRAYGSPGEIFDLQASTNLQTWVDLGDIVADTNGLVQFDDTNASLFPDRFYYTIPQ